MSLRARTAGLIVIAIVIFASGCTSQTNNQVNSGTPTSPKTYSLPANDIPDDVRRSLHPWIAGFIGLTTTEATDRLHKRWENISLPSLLALRKVLSEFEVRGIVDHDVGGMIFAVRPGTDANLIGNSFFIPAPLDSDALASRLTSVRLADNVAVREFMDHFAGLAEDTATMGQFVYLESPWPTFTDSWDSGIEGFDLWKNSLMLYHARNGCPLLVRSDGKVAWWIVQENLVREQADNFDIWVGQFSEHRKLAKPYDPYHQLP